MNEAEVTWPTLLASRHQHQNVTNQLAERPRTPTWPASLPTPSNHASPQPQPNLYLQLSQILEWEIWNHNQTRGGLCSELTRRTELEAQVWKLNHELAQWHESCHIAYAALDEHRAENSNLKLDVEALAAELRELRDLRQLQVQSRLGCPTPPLVPDETQKTENEMLHDDGLPQLREEDACAWRLGFIRDIEEHLSGSE